MDLITTPASVRHELRQKSRVYPASYAEAKFLASTPKSSPMQQGNPSLSAINLGLGQGNTITADERDAKSGNYLGDDIVQRAAKGPIVFD